MKRVVMAGMMVVFCQFSPILAIAARGQEVPFEKAFAAKTLHSEMVEAALSIESIDVTTDFSGADILLFGSTEPNLDIVVVVRGPSVEAVVHHKRKKMGIWVNAEKQEYENVPMYYYVASNRPLNEFLSPQDQESFGFGFAAFDWQKQPSRAASPGHQTQTDFDQALIMDRVRQGLYRQSFQGIQFIGARLFRMDLRLSSDIPVGIFRVDIYAFDDGGLRAMRSTRFTVDKIGFGAAIDDFAHQHPLFYGILAVLVAVSLGGMAAWIFRRI